MLAVTPAGTFSAEEPSPGETPGCPTGKIPVLRTAMAFIDLSHCQLVNPELRFRFDQRRVCVQIGDEF